MATSRLLLSRRIVEIVLANSTKVIDSILEEKVYSIEYHINMRKLDNTISKTIKVLVDADDIKVSDSVGPRIGHIDVLVNIQKDSGYIKLQLQNNEAFDIGVRVIRQLT